MVATCGHVVKLPATFEREILNVIFFIFSFVFFGCSQFEKKNKPDEPTAELDLTERVRNLKNKYCELSAPLISQNGMNQRCDGLLFASLHNIACGFPEISVYEGEPGQWFRSPGHDCFIPPNINNGADSQSSKDMMQGWFLKMARDGNRGAVKAFLNRTEKYGGFFCEADSPKTRLTKCFLPPTTIKLMIDFVESNPPPNEFDLTQAGFEAHLAILRQLQNLKVYGAVSNVDLQMIEFQANRQPENALFVAVKDLFNGGDMTNASNLLLSQCPEKSLPTNHDNYCTDYRYERDKAPQDWEPCPEKPFGTHLGTDCAFAATVILGDL